MPHVARGLCGANFFLAELHLASQAKPRQERSLVVAVRPMLELISSGILLDSTVYCCRPTGRKRYERRVGLQAAPCPRIKCGVNSTCAKEGRGVGKECGRTVSTSNEWDRVNHLSIVGNFTFPLRSNIGWANAPDR